MTDLKPPRLRAKSTGLLSLMISLQVCCMLLLVPSLVQSQYVTSDTYTRYELLAPETNSFRIFYEVTETAPGSRRFGRSSTSASGPRGP